MSDHSYFIMLNNLTHFIKYILYLFNNSNAINNQTILYLADLSEEGFNGKQFVCTTLQYM